MNFDFVVLASLDCGEYEDETRDSRLCLTIVDKSEARLLNVLKVRNVACYCAASTY